MDSRERHSYQSEWALDIPNWPSLLIWNTLIDISFFIFKEDLAYSSNILVTGFRSIFCVLTIRYL